MLHNIVDQLLKIFGRDVLEQWIPLDRLRVTSITDPELYLTDIPVPSRLFEHFPVPFAIVKSNISKVTIKCPWRTILKGHVDNAFTVKIENVELILRVKNLNEWSADSLKSYYAKVKRKNFIKWDKFVSNPNILSRSRNRSLRISKILRSLSITVHNVKVTLVDGILYKDPFSIIIQADTIYGFGLNPKDSNLNSEENRGIEKSLLTGLWFTSNGVHIWYSVYQGPESGNELSPCGLQSSSTNSSDPKDFPEELDMSDWKSDPLQPNFPVSEKNFPESAYNGEGHEDETQSEFSEYSHSSDELFEFGDKKYSETSNIVENKPGLCFAGCTVPCYSGNLDEIPVNAKSTREDDYFLNILRLPYRIYNLTTPTGVQLDVVCKCWDFRVLSVIPGVSDRCRNNIDIFLTASTNEHGRMRSHPPVFDGSIKFDPFYLVLTDEALEAFHNIFRYIQLLSIFRSLSIQDICRIPSLQECRKYIELRNKSLLLHSSESDLIFMKGFEDNTPFHIIIKIRELAISIMNWKSNVGGFFSGNVCCGSVGCGQDQENLEFVDGHKRKTCTEWFFRDSAFRFMAANVNVELVFSNEKSCLHLDHESNGSTVLPSVILQMSTFVLENASLYSERSTFKLICARPILKCGMIEVAVKHRTFSAKVTFKLLPHCEKLFSYPELLFSHPQNFFDRYGSDDISILMDMSKRYDAVIQLSIDRYINNVKSVYLAIPKLVVILNSLMHIDSYLDSGIWQHMTNMLLTLELLDERSKGLGVSNSHVFNALKMRMEHSGRILFTCNADGVVLKLFTGSLETVKRGQFKSGDDSANSLPVKDSRKHFYDAKDLYIFNDSILDKWEYCEDIEDPFPMPTENGFTNNHKDYGNIDARALSKVNLEEKSNNFYTKEHFLSELTKEENCLSVKYPEESFGEVNPNVIDSSGHCFEKHIAMQSGILEHISAFRKLYKNTLAVDKLLYLDSDDLSSLEFTANRISIHFDSLLLHRHFSVKTIILGCTCTEFGEEATIIEFARFENINFLNNDGLSSVKISNIFLSLFPYFYVVSPLIKNKDYLQDYAIDKVGSFLRKLGRLSSVVPGRTFLMEGSQVVHGFSEDDLKITQILALDEFKSSEVGNSNFTEYLGIKETLGSKDDKRFHLSVNVLTVKIMEKLCCLYEANVTMIQFEMLQSQQTKFRFNIGNSNLIKFDETSFLVLMSSDATELNKRIRLTKVPVENGQIALDYTFDAKNAKNVILEIRNLHYCLDMDLIDRCLVIFNQFFRDLGELLPATNDHRPKVQVLNLRVLLHDLTIHNCDIGIKPDLYAVFSCNITDKNLDFLELNIPRMHVTILKDIIHQLVSFSLLDLKCRITSHYEAIGARNLAPKDETPRGSSLVGISSKDHSIANPRGYKKITWTKINFSISNCAIWGLHRVDTVAYERLNNLKGAKFRNLDEASNNFIMLLEEIWFNPLSTALIPSSTCDDTEVVLVPLLLTRLPKSVRLASLLDHKSIKEWLIGSVDNLESFGYKDYISKIMDCSPSTPIDQQAQAGIYIELSTVANGRVCVTTGTVDFNSLTAFVNLDTIKPIIEVISRSKPKEFVAVLKSKMECFGNIQEEGMPQNTTKNGDFSAKIFKITVSLAGIETVCPFECELNDLNTLPLSMLPRVSSFTHVPAKRPANRLGNYRILCVFRLKRLHSVMDSNFSISYQEHVTFDTLNEFYAGTGPEDIFHDYKFDPTALEDVLDEAKDRAEFHSEKGYNNSYLLTVICNTMEAFFHTPEFRFNHWMRVIGDNCKNIDILPDSPQRFVKDFKLVLKLSLINMEIYFCVASKNAYVAKLSIKSVDIVDAFDKHIIENVFETRRAMEMLQNDEIIFSDQSSSQIVSTLDFSEKLMSTKVVFENTRSEIQLDGINMILGLLQDLGVFSTYPHTHKVDIASEFSLCLDLYEIWFYPSGNFDDYLSNANNGNMNETVAFSSKEETVTETLMQKVAIPKILETAERVKYEKYPSGSLQKVVVPSYQCIEGKKVIGCLLTLTLSHSKKGSFEASLKSFGAFLGETKLFDDMKVLVNERGEILRMIESSEEKMLLEIEQSSLRSKILENGHALVIVEVNMPKLSVNVDQLPLLIIFKRFILDDAVKALCVHLDVLKGKNQIRENVLETPMDDDSLVEELESVLTRCSLKDLDFCNFQDVICKLHGDLSINDISHSKGGAQQNRTFFMSILKFLNLLAWNENDKQISFSVSVKDCCCAVSSNINELVLLLNLQRVKFDLTHTDPNNSSRTVVDSSLVFNISACDSNLNSRENVLQTTVVTTQVVYEVGTAKKPTLMIGIYISGIAIEINSYLIQLMKHMESISQIFFEAPKDVDAKKSQTIQLYNELDVDICILSGKLRKIDEKSLKTLPSGMSIQVSDKYLFLFLRNSEADPISPNGIVHSNLNFLSGISHSRIRDSHIVGDGWVELGGENLLFGNSNNVKNLLNVFKSHDASSNGGNMNVYPGDIGNFDPLLLFLGGYQTEQNSLRLYNIPNKGDIILVKPFAVPNSNDLNILVSSSIRIQNSTDTQFLVYQDNKLGYFTKVAYKLVQGEKQKDSFKSLYLDPNKSVSVPLTWFGNGVMPEIVPIFPDNPKQDFIADSIAFHNLYTLLNKKNFSDSDLNSVSNFTIKFRGYLAFRCRTIATDANRDHHGTSSHCFTLTIEPMLRFINLLPYSITLYLSLHKHGSESFEMDKDSADEIFTNSVSVRRLNPQDIWSIPFSEQRLFLRIKVHGPQLESFDASISACSSLQKDFEFHSTFFQVYLPNVGTASVLKTLKRAKGPIDEFVLSSLGSLKNNSIQGNFLTKESLCNSFKRMKVTLDLSRHEITLLWPFMFENVSTNHLILNGFLIAPRFRLYGNLPDASNSRLRALLSTGSTKNENGKPVVFVSQPVKIDLTSTTVFRTPINLTVPLPKNFTMDKTTESETSDDTEVFLDDIRDNKSFFETEYERGNKRTEFDNVLAEDSLESNFGLKGVLLEEEGMEHNVDHTRNPNDVHVCLGCTVRYAEPPYSICKIVSIANLYTFVNRLPFDVRICGISGESNHGEYNKNDVTMEVVINQGKAGTLNTPFNYAYIMRLENDTLSGVFFLNHQRLPHVFQLELNSSTVIYSTEKNRGLLIQVNVISGVFAGSRLPYTYNGYYFVLSLPSRPQYQILNLTRYKIAYSIPENLNSAECQLIDRYADIDRRNLGTSCMNKVGILSSASVTHYVFAANKSTGSFQVAIKVLGVDANDWHLQQIDFANRSYDTLKFFEGGSKRQIFITIVTRSSGTRIITLVESRKMVSEIKGLKGVKGTCNVQTPWSSIIFSVKTPRIAITLANKRKVILALYLTNICLGIHVLQNNVFQDMDKQQNEFHGEEEQGLTFMAKNGIPKNGFVEFTAIVKSVHIDHFVQGYIPVILKSSAKRNSVKESFLDFRVICSNFGSQAVLIYDLIHFKISPLSINIEMCVIEQLLDSVKKMLKLSVFDTFDVETSSKIKQKFVFPEPKWAEIEPTRPVYIRRLSIEPISLILGIRTSGIKLSHQTLQILDALPLDTPCVCVYFASEKRKLLVVGWRELADSLKHSYFRQFIRQSLPTAWFSNSFAVLHGLFKGISFLFTEPIKSFKRFKNSLEGFILGICNGIVLFILYIMGGFTQSLGHVLNIFHKIAGGTRPKPQGVLDAIWFGVNGLFLQVLYRPWKQLFSDLKGAYGRGENIFKMSLCLVVNLLKCAFCPVFGVLNMLITVVEGFSNVLLGDLEQFTHVYESDQLENSPENTTMETTKRIEDYKQRLLRSGTFIKRMKTSISMRKPQNKSPS